MVLMSKEASWTSFPSGSTEVGAVPPTYLQRQVSIRLCARESTVPEETFSAPDVSSV